MVRFIEIDSKNLTASLRKIKSGLRRTPVPYGRSARHMRDYVRQTITMQGRNRNYAPLSMWTRKRTGRRKALITLRKNIMARWDNTKAEVYFNPRSSSWHIDQHHTGFISPAVTNKRMVIPNKGGGVLAAFSNRKASKIPAREVWPSGSEVNKEVRGIFAKWVDEVARKSWR